MYTHFIPYETRSLGRYREALCGQFIFASQHTITPTCPICRARRADDLADTRTGEDVFGDAAHFATLGGVR